MKKGKLLVGILVTVFFLLGGIVPVHSQEIIATFGFGGQFLDRDRVASTLHSIIDEGGTTRFFYDGALARGTVVGINVLFIGRIGFTISAGVDMLFSVGEGINADPVFGFGFVHYNRFYIGGILNVIPKPYMYFQDNGRLTFGDGFLVPTLVAGYDFGFLALGLQLSYMHGINSSTSGFRFFIGAGVNVGNLLR